MHQTFCCSSGHSSKLSPFAGRPLVVIGKGAAFSQSDAQLRDFVSAAGVPFLATAMGRGVVPDNHQLCANAARSAALRGADVAIIFGARCIPPLLFSLQRARCAETPANWACEARSKSRWRREKLRSRKMKHIWVVRQCLTCALTAVWRIGNVTSLLHCEKSPNHLPQECLFEVDVLHTSTVITDYSVKDR